MLHIVLVFVVFDIFAAVKGLVPQGQQAAHSVELTRFLLNTRYLSQHLFIGVRSFMLHAPATGAAAALPVIS